ncbi:MAG: hypothetical protein SF182_03885 [Deltaproteobacteria bacterium]|nr:hypothetical protein [Deltaproteobacteria bacterium]
MRGAALGALALLAALSSACSQPSYFPMQQGLTWEYGVSFQRTDSDGNNLAALMYRTSTLRILPERQLQGRQVTPISMALGARYSVAYQVEDASGVHTVAVQSPGEDTPHPTPGRIVVRYPLVVGGAWDDFAESMFLEGGTAELPGETRITALDMTTTVPAGTYRHCLELQFSGRGEVQRPLRSDLTPMRIDATFWYAPGVGLVKYVQRDRSPDGSGLFTAELTAFRRE